ncbi:PAS domain-containing protein [Hydrogenophaga sp.]|uniref:PAS domain-containing protein n=1 Tax=Hydrogenophaga sp. TaxID=1904254 RepID=UPI00271ED533|nr:PAS domain-containing protein [Hydrogenophaga sp.]MDO8906463.1 PAS domain-containing protein [Hydrogenophaga sp.]
MANAEHEKPLPANPAEGNGSVSLGHHFEQNLPFEAFFQASPLAASVSRQRDGCLLAVNDAWLAFTGLTRETAIGRTTIELGHWADAAERHRYLEEGRFSHGVQTLTLCDGERHHVRLHTTLLDVQPEPLMLVYFIEATLELKAEAARSQADQALSAANVALQQRVELHDAIEKLALVGHWTNSDNERDVVWSQGLFDITGIEPQEVLSRIVGRSGIHPDDMPAWLEAREALDGRVVDFRWTRPDGQQRWFRTRIGQTTVAGNPRTDFGVIQDVTTEREATLQLAQQLQLLQNIAARVPGIVYQARLRPDGTSAITYVNEAARELLELDPADLQKDVRLLFGRVHADDRDELVAALGKSARDLTIWRQTYRVVLPQRGVRWNQVEAAPQREEDGTIVWHGFTTDVTEARLAAQKVDRQNRMLETVRMAQSRFIEADDKRKAFEGLLDAFLSVTGSEYGFVGEVLYDEQGAPYLKTHAVTNIAWDDMSHRLFVQQAQGGMEFHNLKTLFGHGMVTRAPVIANHPASDARAGGLPKGHPSMYAFLGIPLMVGDRLVAMVGLANQPGGYSEADIEFLQPLLGAVQQLVLAQRDHEERLQTLKQLEDTTCLLAEKSSALQVTLDSVSQGFAMVDGQGDFRFYNRRMLELLDLPEWLFADNPSFERVGQFQVDRGDFGEDMLQVDPAMRPFLVKEHIFSAPETYLRRTRDGKTLEIRTRKLPDGGMVRTYTDVTSYVQAQEALAHERQRLAWVLDATRPGVWETNLVTWETTINEHWATMLGYSVEELLPTTFETWRRLVHPLDLPFAEHVLERHLSGEAEFYECDLRMRHKAGHWIWINDRGRVHQRDADGRPLFMSGTHVDISARVAAQEQVRALNASLELRVSERTAELERSMRDMEAISYSIAHDLRAPLRSVNGFASLIAEEEGDRLSPLARDMFGRITRSSRNMGQMITDMLELLRVVRVDLAAVPVNLHVLAQSVAEVLAPQYEHARIELDTVPEAMGDATLLRQVLFNLMDNGLKYSRHQATPELKLGYSAAQRAYYVRDNGMGFDMAHADKLFGLFQRLHAGSDVPGTGVGLAIVARILERHGGRIWADSAPGQGTTFWFRLPHP